MNNKVVHEIWKRGLSIFVPNNLPKKSIALKVDLWNETVEQTREFSEIYKKAKFGKIIFCEINKELCKLYKKKKGEFVINGDILFLPIKSNSLNVILDISTSDHFPLKKFQNILKEYSRVLKPNGLLILFHENKDYYLINELNKDRPLSIPYYPRKDITIEKLLLNYFKIRRKVFLFSLIFDPFLGSLLRVIFRILRLNSLYNFFIYKLNTNRLAPIIAYQAEKV